MEETKWLKPLAGLPRATARVAQPPDRRGAEERIIHLDIDVLQELFVLAEPDGCANVLLARNASISQGAR